MPVEVASQADISYQDELWVGRLSTGGSPEWSYTQILGVEIVGMPEKMPEDVDVTHQQSPGRSRETKPGLLDATDFSVDLQFWPQHASQIMLDTLHGLTEAGTPESIRVSFVVGGLQRTYRGEVRNYVPTGTVGDKRMAAASFKVFERIDPEPSLPEAP